MTRTRLFGVGALAATLMLSACATFEIENGAVCGNLEMAFDSTTETVHGSLWGFRWSDHVVEKCEDDCGFYRVEYHTNALFVLASVASLGFYVPQTVEWWCQSEARDDSDQEPFVPDAQEPGGGRP